MNLASLPAVDLEMNPRASFLAIFIINVIKTQSRIMLEIFTTVEQILAFLHLSRSHRRLRRHRRPLIRSNNLSLIPPPSCLMTVKVGGWREAMVRQLVSTKVNYKLKSKSFHRLFCSNVHTISDS